MSKKYLATAPVAVQSLNERMEAFEAAAAVESGVASKYWLELLAYPPGSARSLWLFVNNAWRRLDNPNSGVQISVQDAFNNTTKFEVAVWFSGEVIVGLVTRSK